MSNQTVQAAPAVSKPWWQSTTVIFAGVAGGCVMLDGFLQQPVGTSIASAIGLGNYMPAVEMVLEGVAFLASGGAIRGRFLATTPLK